MIRIKKKYESRDGLGLSKIEAKSLEFDFGTLLYRLRVFNSWLADLHAEIGQFENPALINDSAGTSGFKYHIITYGASPVAFNIECGTNMKDHPDFKGTIRVGGNRYDIQGVQDLNTTLIRSMARAYKS